MKTDNLPPIQTRRSHSDLSPLKITITQLNVFLDNENLMHESVKTASKIDWEKNKKIRNGTFTQQDIVVLCAMKPVLSRAREHNLQSLNIASLQGPLPPSYRLNGERQGREREGS